MAKTYQVTLITEGIENVVYVDDDVCIKEAAEDQSVELPYSCGSGACSTCMGKITSGKVEHLDQTFLSEKHMQDGYVLLCVAMPRSDLTILTHMESDWYNKCRDLELNETEYQDSENEETE